MKICTENGVLCFLKGLRYASKIEWTQTDSIYRTASVSANVYYQAN